ncbi:MAG: glycerophosphodiester phosphodiesterase family protein, partial [Pseudomonadota bacterium]|nr:glycerophosphodiester phosphodiesterase family protein [Pseudomonadota bacterium]
MTLPQVAAFSGNSDTIRVVGHRGARGIMPENSLVGFDFALSIGVNLLEFDVVMTRDHVP